MIVLLENPTFDLESEFLPTGDQPQAIEKLVEGVQKRKIKYA